MEVFKVGEGECAVQAAGECGDLLCLAICVLGCVGDGPVPVGDVMGLAAGAFLAG